MAIPATEMADLLGNTRVANMIILGAYAAFSGIMSIQEIKDGSGSVVTSVEEMAHLPAVSAPADTPSGT